MINAGNQKEDTKRNRQDCHENPTKEEYRVIHLNLPFLNYVIVYREYSRKPARRQPDQYFELSRLAEANRFSVMAKEPIRLPWAG